MIPVPMEAGTRKPLMFILTRPMDISIKAMARAYTSTATATPEILRQIPPGAAMFTFTIL
jgi:hypothetical protein